MALAFEIPKSILGQVDELLRQDKYRQAVKLVRQETGAGLGVGTRAIDHRQKQLESGPDAL